MEMYLLRDGFSVSYDKSVSLPPDSVSEMIGVYGAKCVDTTRFLYPDTSRIFRVLELGVGSGVILTSFLATVENPENIDIWGIDIDPDCIRQTEHNLKSVYKRRNCTESIALNLFTGSWFDTSVWEKLFKHRYDVIFFNPPYLPSHETVRHEFLEAPSSAMFTSDSSGLEHYEACLPTLVMLLSEERESSLMIRLPRAPKPEFERGVFSLFNMSLKDWPYYYTVEPHLKTTEDRMGVWKIVCRSPYTPAFLDPLLFYAKSKGFDAETFKEMRRKYAGE